MKAKTKKFLSFICAIILLLSSTCTNIGMISSAVYAVNEDISISENEFSDKTELISNEDISISENEFPDETEIVSKEETIIKTDEENTEEVIDNKEDVNDTDTTIENIEEIKNNNDNYEGSNKEEIIEDLSDEENEDILNDENLILAEDYGIMPMANAGEVSSVQYHGSVSYGGSKVGNFTVNGKQAFCMAHSKKTPPTGTGITASIYNDDNISKCLYYGWTGDGQWAGFTSEAMGIVMTSLALDYFYNGNNHKVANSFINFVNSQPSPTHNLTFTNSNLTGHVSGDQQTTEAVTLLGDSKYTISFNLQPSVQLHNMTQGTISDGYVTLRGGDTFWLSAPLSIAPSWTSENINNTAYKYSTIIWLSGNSTYQPIGQQDYSVDPGYYINLTVNWAEQADKGSLKIIKTDEAGALLNGAKVKITSENGYSNENLEITNGTITITDLEPGNFTVQEIEAPEGYQIDETPFDVEIKAGQTASVTILNGAIPPPTAEIGIVKTNEDGSAPVSGALFKVWNDGEYNETFRTDASGKINIEGLEVGTYQYQEISAPYRILIRQYYTYTNI